MPSHATPNRPRPPTSDPSLRGPFQGQIGIKTGPKRARFGAEKGPKRVRLGDRFFTPAFATPKPNPPPHNPLHKKARAPLPQNIFSLPALPTAPPIAEHPCPIGGPSTIHPYGSANVTNPSPLFVRCFPRRRRRSSRTAAPRSCTCTASHTPGRQLRLPQQLARLLVEGVEHLVLAPADEDQAPCRHDRAAEVLRAGLRDALRRQLRKLAQRDAPRVVPPRKVDRVQQPQGGLIAG